MIDRTKILSEASTILSADLPINQESVDIIVSLIKQLQQLGENTDKEVTETIFKLEPKLHRINKLLRELMGKSKEQGNIVERDGFVLFWSGYLSNWFKSSFTIDGQVYCCGEQWMMAEKARYFGDVETLKKILKTNSPQQQKNLGRQVKNFDAKKWSLVARDLVYTGLLEKFKQNLNLKKLLLATGDKILVESSPTDVIWGTGFAADHPNATDPSKWKGTNWLGQALMKVREGLITVETMF